jgi:peptide/nickel transport system ATP-binding protein
MQVVFQDPVSSLDPRMPVSDLIAEPLGVFNLPTEQTDARVSRLLEMVGLDPSYAERYPQQLSGGQCQRVCIARALALEPRLLILDEPVSALDVSIRAGIINLLQTLKHSLGLSYLFITHDLALVRYFADRVAVMYLGNVLETGAADAVCANPAHPYTRCLISAAPVPDPAYERDRQRILPKGELPSAVNPPPGCRFHTRCPKKTTLTESQQTLCVSETPLLQRLSPAYPAASMHNNLSVHECACHFAA